jgi:O-antigen/teichoic acid export membrane protein
MPSDSIDPLPETPSSPELPTTSQSTLGRIAVRITVWASIGTYLNQFIAFGATLVMTRLLDPSVFGTFSLATFWYTLLNLRPKAGLNYSAIRRSDSNNTLLGTYWGVDAVLALGSLVLSVIVGISLLQLDAAFPGLNYTPAVVISLVVLMAVDAASALFSPLSMILEKELQVSRLVLVALVAAVAAYAVAIVLAFSGAGIGALLAINIITMLISGVGIVIVCRRRWPQAFHGRWHFDRTLARRLLRDGLPTGLSLTAINSIVTQYDNFLIGTFVGVTTLGYYDRAYRIATWTNILLTLVISRIGFLTFSRVRDDAPRLTQAVRLSLWVLLTLGIPITLVLFFGAADIVKILYTDRYSESAYYLRFLTIYSLFSPFINLAFWLAVSVGDHRRSVSLTSVQAATLILLGTPFTFWWGVNGTLVAVMITMAAAFILGMRYIFGKVPLSKREVFVAHVLAMLIAILALWLIQQWSGWTALTALMRLIVVGLVGPGLFAGTLLLLRPAETRERIGYVRRMFAARAAR